MQRPSVVSSLTNTLVLPLRLSSSIFVRVILLHMPSGAKLDVMSEHTVRTDSQMTSAKMMSTDDYFGQARQLQRRRQWHPTPVLLPGKPLDGGAWKAAVHGVAEGQT